MCSGWSVPEVMSRKSCLCSPVLAVCPGISRPVLLVPFKLSCSCFPFLAVLSKLSCPGCSAPHKCQLHFDMCISFINPYSTDPLPVQNRGQIPCAYPSVGVHMVARCSSTITKAWRACLLAVKEQITITELTYAGWQQIRPPVSLGVGGGD